MWPGEEVKSAPQAALIKNKKGSAVFETLLVCILIGVVIGAVFPYFHRATNEAREVALRSGLNNIRKGVQLYHFLNRDYPTDLRSLVHQQYVAPARDDTFFKGEYLSEQTLDSEGNLLDPFQNPYQYDRKRGKVVSGTKDYETW